MVGPPRSGKRADHERARGKIRAPLRKTESDQYNRDRQKDREAGDREEGDKQGTDGDIDNFFCLIVT